MSSQEERPDSELGTDERRPTIVFVVDNSDSMLSPLPNDPDKRPKKSVVPDLIRVFINETIGQADYGLIVFGGSGNGVGCEAVKELVKPSDIDHDIFAELAKLEPGGGTPTIMALEEAVKVLEGRAGVYRKIVLISDDIDRCFARDKNEREREQRTIDRIRELLAQIKDRKLRYERIETTTVFINLEPERRITKYLGEVISDVAKSPRMSLKVEEGGTYSEALCRFSDDCRRSAALENEALKALLRHNQLAAEFSLFADEMRVWKKELSHDMTRIGERSNSFADEIREWKERLEHDIRKNADRWENTDIRLSRAEKNRRTYFVGGVVFFLATLTGLGYQYLGSHAHRAFVWGPEDLAWRQEVDDALAHQVTHKQLEDLKREINDSFESRQRAGGEAMEAFRQQLEKVASQAREARESSDKAMALLSIAGEGYSRIKKELDRHNKGSAKNDGK